MSTFVAHRLRRACASAARDHEVGVSTLTAGMLPGTDVLLVGNHVPRDAESVLDAAAGGTAVVILPANIASDLDGHRTLDLVEAALAENPHPTDKGV
jgi:PTS system cellobiose-specific IIB component